MLSFLRWMEMDPLSGEATPPFLFSHRIPIQKRSKYQVSCPFFSFICYILVFTTYGRGGHVGHMTRTGWRLDGWIDGWMQFYVLFNSISVISGRWVGDNKRVSALESRSWLQRSTFLAGLEPETARSAGQHLTYWATEAPLKHGGSTWNGNRPSGLEKK